MHSILHLETLANIWLIKDLKLADDDTRMKRKKHS